MSTSVVFSAVLSLLVPFVDGSCLPDAIPPALRRNLVNANGETYPVGFFISNWPACFAANIVGATLVEEVLGYHTMVNFENPGGGTVAAYYGVTGCRTPDDAADRGCLQGVTYYHVHLESWMGGYPADWNFIQQNYKLMAPKDLGSMGYPGYTTMFFPQLIQQQAFSTQGLALEYYRNWNASWNQAWNFFGSISSISFSQLSPCNNSDTIMSSDATMRRHVKFTADSDGVVIENDIYRAKCNDGFWWAPPSCRQTNQCIPWITAGNGWGAEVFMQKFTIFNMPAAIGIAATWTDYTTVPLSGDMTFFWWAPDPTFLDVNPMVMKWPPHNRREFSEGLLTSEDSAAVVGTIVSRDLQVLAPDVESFLDNLEMAMSEMNSMLLDQKNTGDSWQNVTCRWITDNRALWEKWLPDESKCHPGFGLYDSVLQDFTNARVNVVNKIVCEACPPGTFSQELKDNKGITYVCLPCGLGTHQDSGASMSCTPCHAGEYQDENRSAECKRCDFGFYQDEHGQVACKSCPESTSTLGLGSISQRDCGCPAEYIDMNSTEGGYDCTKCGTGMICPALSSVVDMKSGILGENGPQIQSGFFATMDAPTEVFKCGERDHCPGGTPNSCASGLIGTPCARCPAGSTWTGVDCDACGGWRETVWALAMILSFVLLVLAYYLTTSKVTAKAWELFATVASFGILVMSMQNLGLVGMMTVQWPSSLDTLFSVCQFLLLDIDNYGFSCVAGPKELIRYLLSATVFPIGIAWLLLIYGLTRLFFKKRYHWEISKVASASGAFLQLGFSTMTATALAPMTCYKHPNGRRSLLKYPGVICGSATHDAMLAIGWTLLIVFVLGFVALCVFAVWKVPTWSALGKSQQVQAVRFLIFRFRLDSWWYGVPLLVRGPLLNVPVALATDYPPFQVVVICTILTAMMVIQMLVWPWKVPMLNVTDSLLSVGMVLVVTTSAMYITEVDDVMYEFASIVSTTMLGAIGFAVFIMCLMTVSALIWRGSLGGRKELKIFNMGMVADSTDIAQRIKEMADDLQQMNLDLLSSQLALLSVFDINMVTTSLTLLATEVVRCDDPRSFRFNRRIASSSFEVGKRVSLYVQGQLAVAAEKEVTNEVTNTDMLAEEPESNTKTEWI